MFARSWINALKRCLIAAIFQEHSIVFNYIKEVNGICHVKSYAEQKLIDLLERNAF